jgi:hypothetical protein
VNRFSAGDAIFLCTRTARLFQLAAKVRGTAAARIRKLHLYNPESAAWKSQDLFGFGSPGFGRVF